MLPEKYQGFTRSSGYQAFVRRNVFHYGHNFLETYFIFHILSPLTSAMNRLNRLLLKIWMNEKHTRKWHKWYVVMDFVRNWELNKTTWNAVNIKQKGFLTVVLDEKATSSIGQNRKQYKHSNCTYIFWWELFILESSWLKYLEIGLPMQWGWELYYEF